MLLGVQNCMRHQELALSCDVRVSSYEGSSTGEL